MLWDDLIAKRGPMRRVDAKTRQRLGVTNLYLIHLEWPENYLDLRLDFDDQDRITGLWIDTPIDGETAFEPKGGFQFGSRIKVIAGWNRTLEVRVENSDGTSGEHCVVAFYREVKAGEDSQSNDWIDSSSGRSWRDSAQYSGAGVATATRLAAGWYRVLAGETSTTVGPLVSSEPIELAESSVDSQLTVRFDVSGTVRIVDRRLELPETAT